MLYKLGVWGSGPLGLSVPSECSPLGIRYRFCNPDVIQVGLTSFKDISLRAVNEELGGLHISQVVLGLWVSAQRAQRGLVGLSSFSGKVTICLAL